MTPTTEDPDRAVISRAAAGDDQAYTDLYNTYRPEVAALVWRAARDADEPEPWLFRGRKLLRERLFELHANGDLDA